MRLARDSTARRPPVPPAVSSCAHGQHRGAELGEVEAIERGDRHAPGSSSNASAATRPINPGSR